MLAGDRDRQRRPVPALVAAAAQARVTANQPLSRAKVGRHYCTACHATSNTASPCPTPAVAHRFPRAAPRCHAIIFPINDRRELQDTKFAMRAVKDHNALFDKAPLAHAYDRGGYSTENVTALKKLGVKEVGLAPRGRTQWSVSGPVRDRLVRERAMVEAGIGTIKGSRYAFNRPAARSEAMMGACGQRAVLGFNTNKLVRELAGRKGMMLTG